MDYLAFFLVGFGAAMFGWWARGRHLLTVRHRLATIEAQDRD